MALRGHASIQGSTDIPTLYNILPGYIPMPHAGAHDNLAEFVELNTSPSRLLGEHGRLHREPAQGLVGRRRDAENDFCFDYLPRITGDHSHLPDGARHARRQGEGLHRRGPEPGRRLGQRAASPRARWPTSTGWSSATWSRSRRRRSGTTRPRSSRASSTRRDRHRGLLPAGGRAHREGRLVHEHPATAAVAPQGGRATGRLPLRALVLLPPRAADPREAGRLARRSATGRSGAHLGLPDVGRDRRAERRGGAARDQRLGRGRRARPRTSS